MKQTIRTIKIGIKHITVSAVANCKATTIELVDSAILAIYRNPKITDSPSLFDRRISVTTKVI